MAGKNEEKKTVSLYGWMIVFIVIVNVIICNYISMARVYVLVFVISFLRLCVCLYKTRVIYDVSLVYDRKIWIK